MKLYESEGHKVKAFLLPGRGQNVGKATVSGAESKDKRTGGMESRSVDGKDCELLQPSAI